MCRDSPAGWAFVRLHPVDLAKLVAEGANPSLSRTEALAPPGPGIALSSGLQTLLTAAQWLADGGVNFRKLVTPEAHHQLRTLGFNEPNLATAKQIEDTIGDEVSVRSVRLEPTRRRPDVRPCRVLSIGCGELTGFVPGPAAPFARVDRGPVRVRSFATIGCCRNGPPDWPGSGILRD